MNLEKYQHFNIEKIIQIFAYIQKKAETYSKLELIKYLFFADRYNLRRNLSLISLDNYYAMKLGPVASTSLNVLKKEMDYLDNFPETDLKQLDKILTKGIAFIEISENEIDLLSEKEIKSIELAINTFKGTPFIEISHEYPEWKKFEELFLEHLTSREPIDMIDFFSNPDIDNSPLLKKYFNCKDPMYEDEEYLKAAKEFCCHKPEMANVPF